jgi:hypothetical protein
MTRKQIFILLFILTTTDSYSQKFMVQNNGLDTLPFEQSISIYSDTFSINGKTYYPGDTSFGDPCYFFEIINNKIYNQRDKDCDSIGLWMIKKDDSTLLRGKYSSWGKKTGIWKTFDKNDKVIEEIEYAHNTILKHYEYVNGVKFIVLEKPWFDRFYLKYALPIWIAVALILFSRLFVNSSIYNDENGTNYSVIYFSIGPFVTKSDNFRHSFKCTYTFWWNLKRLKEGNKPYAKYINMTTIVLTVVIGLITLFGNIGTL